MPRGATATRAETSFVDAGDIGTTLEPGSWPAIADYAAIGDCRTVALIDKAGSVDWLCLPAISSPSVFGAILDREKGGCFAIRPREVVRVERSYLDGSNILETRFTTPTGRVTVTDCMPLLPDPQRRLRLEPTRELLRVVQCTEGHVAMEVLYQPRPDYGRVTPRLKRRGKLGWFTQHRGNMFNLLSTVEMHPDGPRCALTATFDLEAGQEEQFSFTFANEVGVITSLGDAAHKRVDQTQRWWNEWSLRCRYDGPYADLVKRSLLTLKLMSYAPSGALIGAPTCSLPEAIGGARNWDYRYCWPRDATLTLRALIEMGYAGEARAFMGWLLHSTRLTRPALLPMYDIYGRPAPAESTLDHLSGYRDSRPVRLGNGANHQLQLDIYGAVILAAYDFVVGGGELARQEWKLIVEFAEEIVRSWREPDNGIWEMRGGRQHYTYSKLMCWVGLDRLLKMPGRDGKALDAAHFEKERDAIGQAIEERAWNPKVQSYTGMFDSTIADASLLLMGRLGYREPDDPRITSTLAYIDRKLDDRGFLRRYEHGTDHDSSKEGTFGMCSFWRIDLLAMRGEIERARELFEVLVTSANDVGQLSEEYDPDTGEMLGNFPQAFTHIGLITAALSLDQAERRRQKDQQAKEDG